MAITVDEALLRAIATKDKQISDGRTLATKGAFTGTGQADDGGLVWGDCHGSAVYHVSVDLAAAPPVVRCTCPVKPPPCKHALGLLVLLMTRPGAFAVGTPPADLAEKRAKSAERAEKRAEVAAKPRVVNKQALDKKTAEQREALDLLEGLLVDLAGGGLGQVDAARAQRLADQARQLTDAYLKGASFALQRLASLAAGPRGPRDAFTLGHEAGEGLPPAERETLMMRHLTRLWAIVRKGRKYLEAKLEPGEQVSDSDATLEELLGHDWKLVELKERGLVRENVELVEVAFERHDDTVRGERVEESWLADLSDGQVYVDRHMRPLAALERVRGGQSFDAHLTVREAGIYPGFVNRRIRWEIGAHTERGLAPADRERLHARAHPTIEAAVARYKDQVKNPLAPDDAVVLVRAADVQRVGGSSALALVDASGARLRLEDSPIAPARTTSNLAQAAGARLVGGRLAQPATLAVRLYLGLADGAVRGQALALIGAAEHVRLGM